MTVMAVVNMVWMFVSAHWHKFVAVAAFFLAVYNKSQHSNLIKAIVAEPTPQPMPVQKPKKSKKSKSKSKR